MAVNKTETFQEQSLMNCEGYLQESSVFECLGRQAIKKKKYHGAGVVCANLSNSLFRTTSLLLHALYTLIFLSFIV